jgi:4-hydroxythreonine-4-phosphate dehydrogenase
MGDPAGIAPEITALAWKALSSTNNHFFVIGAPEVYAAAFTKAGWPPIKLIDDPAQCSDVFNDGLPVLPIKLPQPAIYGKPCSKNALAIIQSIQMAVDYCRSKKAAAIVTNPIAKSILYQAGFKHPGHTEFLGELARNFTHWQTPHGPIMMLCGGGIRVALVSVHCPLHQVTKQITKQAVEQAARVLHNSLNVDFAITNPKIAMCGLNPHAGEDGTMGIEERDILNPTVQKLRNEGIDISNALPADTVFIEQSRKNYDGVLAMYHDQGLIPVKTLDFHGGTNVTIGLPFIRVSPDHGTGFDIAGKGLARADSLIAALLMANQVSRNHNMM